MSVNVNRNEFREAMSRLGAAVNVLTTAGPAGQVGLTVSAVCSVSDAPPTLLTCIRRESALHDIFCDNGNLCINVLAAHQQDLSPRFAGQHSNTMAERFALNEWEVLATGAPALVGAVAAVDARIVERVAVGTHSVLICEVVAIRLGQELSGLMYFGRSYHPLAAAPG